MNVFKFLSATLLAGICLFSGCKKEKSIVPENPSVVEITVSNSKGELLGVKRSECMMRPLMNPSRKITAPNHCWKSQPIAMAWQDLLWKAISGFRVQNPENLCSLF